MDDKFLTDPEEAEKEENQMAKDYPKTHEPFPKAIDSFSKDTKDKGEKKPPSKNRFVRFLKNTFVKNGALVGAALLSAGLAWAIILGLG